MKQMFQLSVLSPDFSPAPGPGCRWPSTTSSGKPVRGSCSRLKSSCSASPNRSSAVVKMFRSPIRWPPTTAPWLSARLMWRCGSGFRVPTRDTISKRPLRWSTWTGGVRRWHNQQKYFHCCILQYIFESINFQLVCVARCHEICLRGTDIAGLCRLSVNAPPAGANQTTIEQILFLFLFIYLFVFTKDLFFYPKCVQTSVIIFEQKRFKNWVKKGV